MIKNIIVLMAVIALVIGLADAATATDPKPMGYQSAAEQTNTDVNQAIYQQQVESMIRDEAEGEELATAPLLEEGSEEAISEEIKPTPTVQVDRRLKKSFSVESPEQESHDQSEPVKLPGEDLEIGNEEIELDTAPIYQDDQAAKVIKKREPPMINVSLDRKKVHLDESFTLTLELTVESPEAIGDIRLPKMVHFDLINKTVTESRVSVKGALWQHQKTDYVFLGVQPGVFRINPIKIIYAGKSYQSKTLKIRIQGTNSGVTYRRRFGETGYDQKKLIPGAPKTRQVNQEGVFFMAEVDRDEVYVNQQITLTQQLQYTSTDKTTMVYSPPMVTGFITEPLMPINKEEQISSTKERLLDKQYRTALFPIREGTFTIGVGKAVISDRNQHKEYVSDAIAINVNPLPIDPKPIDKQSSNYLVGHYQLIAAWEKDEGRVNQPFKLLITLEGLGNGRTAPNPEFDMGAKAQLYLEKTEDRVFARQGKIYSVKEYHYLTIFEKPGTMQFEPIGMRYFDPALKQWQTAHATIPAINLLPETELAQHVIRQPRFETTALQLKPDEYRIKSSTTSLARNYWFWIVQAFGPIAIMLVWLGRRRFDRMMSDTAAYRTKRAYPVAKKALRYLKKLIFLGEVKAFYDGLTRVTTDYLSAKFNLPTSFINAERLNDYFTAHQMPTTLVASFKVALTACEYVRYAAVTLPVRDMHALHNDLKKAVKEFETLWRAKQKNKKKPLAAMVILFFALFGSAMADDPDLLFAQAKVAIDKVNHQEAEKILIRLLNQGITAPEVYYNLGNLYLRDARLGEAILAYKRAAWLSPRNQAIKYNLKQAEQFVETRFLEAPSASFMEIIQSFYKIMNPDELLLVATVMYWCLIVLIILGIVRIIKRQALKKWIWLTALGFIIMTGWSAARLSESLWWQEAVVVTDQAPLVSRPYSQAEQILTMPEGLSVTVLHYEEPWVEIEINSDQRGWVKRHNLGLIK